MGVPKALNLVIKEIHHKTLYPLEIKESSLVRKKIKEAHLRVIKMGIGREE